LWGRGDVLDRGDLDAVCLECCDGGVAAGTGALHLHLDAAQTVLHRGAGGLLGSHLRGERRALARALEADAADDAHEMTLPYTSVMETMVLLNELLM
jgi:hypothetical protein